MAAENPSLVWSGLGGTKHRFWFVDLSLTRLISQPGVYMFVRWANQVWEPLYIGIADDLPDRLTGHERWAEAVKLGATHLVAQGLAAPAARQKAEQDLIGSGTLR
ncbi:MAG: hypothetical protein GEV13_32290 [Rhodospirillales bacterium]|nr:hypothetical protein [Rhodospirillales bacterium]